MKNKSDTFLVSFDYTHGDIPVLIVGRRGTEKEIDIVNAFKGNEAKELYQKLTKKVGTIVEIEKRKIVGLLATFCLGFDLVMTVLAVLAIL